MLLHISKNAKKIQSRVYSDGNNKAYHCTYSSRIRYVKLFVVAW
jgi:hypothetical protein